MIPNEKRFEGLAVSEFQNITHVLVIETEQVTVQQSNSIAGSQCKTMAFAFEMDNPVRFRLDVLLPETIVNACVTLNSQVLIGYFSSIFPEGGEFPVPNACDNTSEPGHERFSTLHPGRFQSINFKWQPGDVLKYYFYYT